MPETSHAQPVPGQIDERFDNPLERLRLLAGDDDAIASFLDELDVRSPRERQMLAELARAGPLAHPDRFDADHRRLIEALESLRRHGFHGSRSGTSLGPFRPVVRWLVELVARYLVVSYVKTVVTQMRNLYWARELESESSSRELKLLRPARFDATALVEIMSSREIGVPSFVIAGLLLPLAATYRAALHVHAGSFAAASSLIEEADAITQGTGMAPLKYASMMLAAVRGDEAGALELFEAGRLEATARGEGSGLGVTEWTTALLYNGLGRYAEALAAAQRAAEHEDAGRIAWVLVELIEAGARSGATDAAQAALDRLTGYTRASGTEWALGSEAGSRALLSNGRDAESLYREAIERLARSRAVIHLARAQLRYGEWLRRENRRVDAREQLRAAHDTFSRIGAEGFAERTRVELQATGETARARSADTLDALTPQEAQIARMASDRQTNPEIAAKLYISPRTVEYHLRKVFSKLGVNSRKELRSALSSAGAIQQPG